MTQFSRASAVVAVLVLVLQPAMASQGAPSASDSGYAPRHLTSAQAAQDVAILRRALEDIHPGYGRYTSVPAMAALLDQLERAVSQGATDMALYRDVSRIVAHLRCEHTKAELPETVEQYRSATPTYLPFSFRLFDGRMIVDRLDKTQAGLARGDEILALNGRPSGRVLADVASYISIDGWTDHAKRIDMEYSSEYLGDAVDHFWPFLYGWPQTWSIRARDRKMGQIKTVTLRPLTYDVWQNLARGDMSRYVNFPETVEFRMLDPAAGYLKIGTFVNYRTPVPPTEVFDPVFNQLRDKQAHHLVIDLRSCGGGSDDVPAALTTYLTGTIIPLAKRPPWVRTFTFGDLRPHLSTWDDSVFNQPAELFTELGNGYYQLNVPTGTSQPAPPRDNRFAGRVTILSSAANASGSTMFIAMMQAHYGARVVGEATGGSAEGPTAGIILFLKLPNSGIKVRVPALRSWVNIPHPSPGLGVTPDVEIRPTVEDWLSKTDIVLQRALRP